MCTNTLGTVTDVFQTDETNSLTVVMQVGELNSVSQTAFLNDTNLALIGSPSTDVWELVSWRDATLNSGVYTLSGFIRGKRGTDVFANSHAAGEFFVPVTASTLFAFRLALGQLNTAFPYKFVPPSSIPENVSAENFTGLGYDLKPYAPAQLTAVLDGSSNIDLDWERRTRVGGEGFLNGAGTVPLAEDSELYEVDIKDGPGGTVLRTLGSGGTLSTSSVQYDAADITTDFGSTPSNITFSVYQISGSVGRGFEAEATITL